METTTARSKEEEEEEEEDNIFVTGQLKVKKKKWLCIPVKGSWNI